MRIQQIARLGEQMRDELIKTRRDFYMHPELSGEEQRTAGIVAEKLREFGLDVSTGVAGHGVIGLLEGKLPGPVVAWRADMDAFPVQDVLDVPYKSCVPGIKHVCGHDAHTTIGLGIAKVLASMRTEFCGQIKFIFQPAEEIEVGAQAMIEAGGLADPQPEAILALHVAPFQVGKIGCIPGTVLPGKTDFQVTLPGEFAPLLPACLKALRSLNTLGFPSSAEELSRFLASMETGSDALEHFITVACWGMSGNGSGPAHKIQGMIRTANEELRVGMPELIREKLDSVLGGPKVDYQLDWPDQISSPATINDSQLEKRLRPAIQRSIGDGNTMLVKSPFPFNSEDFAHYQQRLPGVMYWLGAANPQRGILAVPHLPDFDVDEECLVVGVKAMSNVLLEYLSQ